MNDYFREGGRGVGVFICYAAKFNPFRDVYVVKK